MVDVPVDDIKRQKRSTLFYEVGRETFNEMVGRGEIPHLQHQNLADLDLRGYDLSAMDLSGAYMRGANLSGLDLRGANLSGVSLKKANVSGCYFPHDLPAEEVRLSLDFGTRLRHRPDSHG